MRTQKAHAHPKNTASRPYTVDSALADADSSIDGTSSHGEPDEVPKIATPKEVKEALEISAARQLHQADRGRWHKRSKGLRVVDTHYVPCRSEHERSTLGLVVLRTQTQAHSMRPRSKSAGRHTRHAARTFAASISPSFVK